MELEREVTVEARSIWRNKEIFLLLASTVLSGISISMYIVFEQLFVLQQLHMSAAYMGLVMIATSLPRVLFMAVGGVLADRFRRSQLMLISLFTRCLSIVILILLLHYGWLNVWLLMGVAFIFGSLDALFWPARDALVPVIVPKDQITRANSFMQTTSQVSILTGPLVGGLAITGVGYEGALIIIFVVLLLGGSLLFFIREPIEPITRPFALFQDLKEGFLYVVRSPLIATLIGLFILVNFFFVGPLMMGIPIIASTILDGSPLALSYLQSALTGGMLIGAMVIAYLNPQRRRGSLILSCLIVEGILLIALSFLTNLVFLIGTMVAVGMCIASINIFGPSIVQENTEVKKLGRVLSLNTTVSMGLIPVGYAAVSGALSMHLSISSIQFYCGWILVGIAIIVMGISKPMRKAD
ncbi:Major Facilitator Superfamily protein [Marininema mesophilum]|uniref:Major Facilitator Superfamily protein n=1 Tax=Marininema mesophilum TaxID=1048340 RepID=A0A1H3ATG6_9BACL|nr:MFS transporter [Marininema mesophilum]SDX32987.1 Major Facilitator Superfamily protein [Marininema mesophilum]